MADVAAGDVVRNPVVDLPSPRPGGRSAPWIERLLRHPQGLVATVLLMLILGMAVSAPILSARGPVAQDAERTLRPPGPGAVLGTDALGRDVLGRLAYGGRVSLLVGGLSVVSALVAGVPLGLAAGYRGGWLELLAMRLVDGLQAFPGLLLALAINAALGSDVRNVIVALAIVRAPCFTRLARAQALSSRQLEYIVAARALGASGWSICLRHLLPNAAAPLIVLATLSAGAAMLAEASLSFLGLGIQPPQPSWGAMLRDGYNQVARAPWLGLFPGVALGTTILAANFLGDGLRDVLDPRDRNRWRREQESR